MSDLLDGGEGEQFVPPLPYDKCVLNFHSVNKIIKFLYSGL